MVQRAVRGPRRRAVQHTCGGGDFIGQPRRPMPHLTMCALVLSNVLAAIAAAASSYLGLFAGMIASAVPYAVASMAVPRTPVAASWINIVQTAGPAGTRSHPE